MKTLIESKLKVGGCLILLAAVFSAFEDSRVDIFNGWFGFMAWAEFIVGWWLIGWAILNRYED